VHLAPLDVKAVQQHVSPGATVIVTHLDGHAKLGDFEDVLVAEDLKTFSL
jgi:hypothetical protein